MAKQLILLATILGTSLCARLDNLAYLPPNQRSTSFSNGGHSSFSSGGHSSFSSGGATGGYQAGGYSANSNQQIPILKFNQDNNGEGSYNYAYETGNSIQAQEQGDAHGDGTRAHGSYSYTAPNGEQVSITYTADENGFVPQGSHIPTSPPIPEAILRALEQNAAEEARGIFDDGAYRGEGLDEAKYRDNGAGAYQGGSGWSNQGNHGGASFGKSSSSSNGGFSGYKY